MTQVILDGIGDLHFIFKEYNDVTIVERLPNQTEFIFSENECLGFTLLDFERKLNRGYLNRNNITLDDLTTQDDVIFFTITIDNQSINGKVNFSSLKE